MDATIPNPIRIVACAVAASELELPTCNWVEPEEKQTKKEKEKKFCAHYYHDGAHMYVMECQIYHRNNNALTWNCSWSRIIAIGWSWFYCYCLCCDFNRHCFCKSEPKRWFVTPVPNSCSYRLRCDCLQKHAWLPKFGSMVTTKSVINSLEVKVQTAPQTEVYFQ